MADIKRVYAQSMPAMKLVGRSYGENDKEGGTFAGKWNEWFKDGLFTPLLQRRQGEEPFEDCDAYIGLCRCKQGEPFRYWIGVFKPLDAPVPAGYFSVALDAGDVAVCWIYGKEPDIYTYCSLSRLREEGYEWAADNNGVKWMFERYVRPRFTNPDESGNVILDMCYYVKPLTNCACV